MEYTRTALFYLTFSLGSNLDELGWELGIQVDHSPACLAHPPYTQEDRKGQSALSPPFL